MISEFGKFCRKLRIDRNEVLKDMADKLNVTSSYLSAIENDKRDIPNGWADLISELYDLDAKASGELMKIVATSSKKMNIDLIRSSQQQKEFAVVFAKKFQSLSSSEIDKILEIMNNDNGNTRLTGGYGIDTTIHTSYSNENCSQSIA